MRSCRTRSPFCADISSVKKSEQFSGVQAHLFDEAIGENLEAIELELQELQTPMPAHIIDKGLPATGLLAQILINKFADHLPLYRQEAIFKRDGIHVPRSSMAQ